MASYRAVLAFILVGLLAACTLIKPGTPVTPNAGPSAVLSGSVMAYATFLDPQSANPAEVAVAQVPVRLMTRDQEVVASAGVATTDAQGHFSFKQAQADGVYLVEASLGVQGRLLTLVRLRSGYETTTVLSLASTYVTSRALASHLRLSGLDQATFDEIAAQARGMIVSPGVAAIADDPRLKAASDAFMAGHEVVRDRLDAMLAGLGIAEGASNASPTPNPTPGASASASPTPAPPDPLFTPEPSPPPPPTLNLSSRHTLEVLGRQGLDSTPGSLDLELPYFVWVTCPASNSIMRIERTLGSASPWARSYPISNALKPRFIPGQIAVVGALSGVNSVPGPNDPAVWVGNQRSDGTQVALFSLTGNFLKAIEASASAPEAVTLDTAGPTRHAWIGAHDGAILVCDLAGNVVARGHVQGAVKRIVAYTDASNVPYVWIATPDRVYRVQNLNLDPATANILADEANMVVFSNWPLSMAWLNGELTSLCLAAYPARHPVVTLQRGGDMEGYLVALPQNMVLNVDTPHSPLVPATSRAVGMAQDPFNVDRNWLATENALYKIDGQSVMKYARSRTLLGFFPGADDTFFGLVDGPPQLVKMVGASGLPPTDSGAF